MTQSKSAGTNNSVSKASPFLIMVADDDEEDRMLIKDALEQAKLVNPLCFVKDGEDLLKYLRNEANPRPSLLLLDLNMPRKDGREALREIKQDPALNSLVIVVLTTSESKEDIERIYELGANSYIAKPVTFDGLVNAMKLVREYWFQLVKLPQGKG